jgi:hypothetical protein
MIGYGSSPIELLATDAMLDGAVFCNFFQYSAVFSGSTALAASSGLTQTVPIQIDDGSDFVIQGMTRTRRKSIPTFWRS